MVINYFEFKILRNVQITLILLKNLNYEWLWLANKLSDFDGYEK